MINPTVARMQGLEGVGADQCDAPSDLSTHSDDAGAEESGRSGGRVGGTGWEGRGGGVWGGYRRWQAFQAATATIAPQDLEHFAVQLLVEINALAVSYAAWFKARDRRRR